MVAGDVVAGDVVCDGAGDVVGDSVGDSVTVESASTEFDESVGALAESAALGDGSALLPLSTVALHDVTTRMQPTTIWVNLEARTAPP